MDLLLDVYGRVTGAVCLRAMHAVRRACRVRVAGPLPPEDQAAIACFWHEHMFAYFIGVGAPRAPRISLYHPKAYLTPWLHMARAEGWTVISGSTGHGGRSAAERIVEHLRKGYSTFVCPDGPSGPPRVLKKGVLHMAQQAGVPIIPIRFSCDRALRLPSWDGKYFPLPSAHLAITYAEPIHVGSGDLEASAERLREVLASRP